MALRRRGGTATLDAWPGYVDALSTLLMVVTFVLLVFVLAQAFLSVKLNTTNSELQKLTAQIAQLSDMLSLEKGRNAELTLAVASLNKAVQQEDAAKTDLEGKLAAANAAVGTDAAALRRAEDANTTLAKQVADAAAEQKDAAARLATVSAEAAGAAAAEASVAADAKAIALLNAQLTQLRLQLKAVSDALGLVKAADTAKDAQIKDLTTRLNLALANKVEELTRYRSEFFGRLRAVLKDVPGVQIVGDRFVFQDEVLFPLGSADLSASGQAQLRKLAATLAAITPKIPPDLHWILRVDGHADPQPVLPSARYQSNWELSAERAINVVRYLIGQGVAPTHLAGTAFGDTEPLVAGTTAADYARDRRIELRLTDR